MIHCCIVFYDMMEKIVFCQKGVSSMDERLRTLQAEVEEEQALRRKRNSLEVEYRSLCSYERELAVLCQKGREDVAVFFQHDGSQFADAVPRDWDWSGQDDKGNPGDDANSGFDPG